MAKIKHTKNELKAQRDALRRYKRYLPTLLLKKQQLQVEVRQLEMRREETEEALGRVESDLNRWIGLFVESADWATYIKLESVITANGNIAGVNIPLLQDVTFKKSIPDLFTTSPWIDDGLNVVEQMLRLRVELSVLNEQIRRLMDELRTTSQRVNLFEKVKIPECEENIRIIRIFLGDAQTAAVARSKLAKNKTMAKELAA